MTSKLLNLFLLSIPLFIAHGSEEILTDFYKIDSHSQFMFGYLNSLPTPQAVFVLFQIMLGLMLIIAYLLISRPKWQMRLMFLPGIIFIYELYHLFKAVSVGGYYPGLITAIPLYIIGALFWKELIRIQTANHHSINSVDSEV